VLAPQFELGLEDLLALVLTARLGPYGHLLVRELLEQGAGRLQDDHLFLFEAVDVILADAGAEATLVHLRDDLVVDGRVAAPPLNQALDYVLADALAQARAAGRLAAIQELVDAGAVGLQPVIDLVVLGNRADGALYVLDGAQVDVARSEEPAEMKR
jgi:hypothetical protein